MSACPSILGLDAAIIRAAPLRLRLYLRWPLLQAYHDKGSEEGVIEHLISIQIVRGHWSSYFASFGLGRRRHLEPFARRRHGERSGLDASSGYWFSVLYSG